MGTKFLGLAASLIVLMVSSTASADWSLFGKSASSPSPKSDLPSISYAAFPLPLLRSYVNSDPGLPAAKAELNSPFPNDFPPSVAIGLEDHRSYPAGEGRYYFPATNHLRIYCISEVERAPYKTIQRSISQLKELLNKRPLVSGSNSHLPDYPPRNAAHCFEVKLAYVDAPWGSGICYVTQFTQDGGSPANNEELTYQFQGISKDGNYYVSANFRITNPKIRKGIDDDQPKGSTPRSKGDYGPDERLLSKEPDRAFTPSLDSLRKWIGAIKIGSER